MTNEQMTMLMVTSLIAPCINDLGNSNKTGKEILESIPKMLVTMGIIATKISETVEEAFNENRNTDNN